MREKGKTKEKVKGKVKPGVAQVEARILALAKERDTFKALAVDHARTITDLRATLAEAIRGGVALQKTVARERKMYQDRGQAQERETLRLRARLDATLYGMQLMLAENRRLQGVMLEAGAPKEVVYDARTLKPLEPLQDEVNSFKKWEGADDLALAK